MTKNTGFHIETPVYLAAILLPLLFSCSSFNKHNLQNNAGGFTIMNSIEAKDITFDALYFDALQADLVDNDPEKAVAKLHKCMQLQPENTAVMFKLGEIYFKNNYLREAAQILEKAVSIDKNNKWYWLLLSDVYKVQKSYSKAIEVYKNLLKLDPENFSYLSDLAGLYIYKQSFNEALKTYNTLEDLYGINPGISLQKEKIYLSLKQPENAINELNKLIKEYPDNGKYIKMLIDLNLALGYEDEIPTLYEQLMQMDSNDGSAMLAMADYYLKKGEDEKGRKLLKEAFENENVDAESKIKYIVTQYQQAIGNDKDYLIELSELIIKIHPDNARAHAFYGDINLELDKKETALTEFEKAVRLDKSVLSLWQKVISLQIEQKKYTDAIAWCDTALEYFPNSSILYYFQGQSYMLVKENTRAVKILESGLAYAFGDKDMEFRFVTSLAEAYNSLKNYEMSDKYFEKAIQLNNKEPLVLNNYAYFLSLRKEKLDYALELSKRSLELDKNNPANLDTYGWILYLSNKYQEAEKYLSKALEQRKWDPDILEHYGDCLYKLGKTNEAVEYWERARKKGNLSDELLEKINKRHLNE